MNPQIKEKHGAIKNRSSALKRARILLFWHMAANPVFVLVYLFFCRTAYRLCMYGGVHKRGSVLLGCLLFFLMYLIFYFYRCCRIQEKEVQNSDWKQIWFYGFHKKGIYVFDKRKRYFEKELTKEERDFAALQYKALPRFRYDIWKVPICIFLVVITVMTGCGIYYSSQNFNGKLSWKLQEYKSW